MSIKAIQKERLFADQPDEQVKKILGVTPSRWGRMSPLCRLLLVETGLVLQAEKNIDPGQRLSDLGKKVGLIGATRRGSMYTDEAFISTMNRGPGLASPALFGYTLPNIPLAEAAVAFGLIGPVYAVFDIEDPLKSAEKEAHNFLRMQSDLDFMLACEFDHFQLKGQQEEFTVTLTVVDSK